MNCRPSTILLLALACAWPLAASAQWQWLDKDGRKVFSDRPPPPEISEKNILKQPGRRPAPAASAPAPDGAAAAAPKAPPVAANTVDKELEAKKKQAEDAEAAKKKADEEKQAKARADNCDRARQSKATLDSGMRIARVNAQGEREMMDDTTRASETARVQEVIASDCK